MHLYQYVQSHTIIILHKQVSVISMTIIMVYYNKNTFTIQIILQKYMKKLLNVTLFCDEFYGHKTTNLYISFHWC